MTKAEDDFWNTSSHSGFNFDDEEDTLSVSSDHAVLRPVTESSELPIHAIISRGSLDLVLDDVASTLQIVVPSAEETIKKMILGHNYNLRSYTKFRDKINILEKSLETCDANVIIEAILYLRGTLKTNIFYHQLAKRKLALKHYGYYLLLKNELDELVNLYMATGNISNMKNLYYLTSQSTINKALLHRKLEQFIMEHLQKLNSNEDKAEFYGNLQFIKFQVDKNTNCNSVVTQLVELCKSELLTHKGLDKLQEFKKAFKIDDLTFDWTLMNVLASMELWMHINDIFIKNNWLTKRNVLKTAVPQEVFLSALGRHNPPKDILETLLACVSDTDKAFALANKLHCHTFIIQYFVNQRDRLALMKYREKVALQSSEYFLIQSALQSTEKKWKN
ncbi:unnamed protein product [Ceutorhynchus assimilis]|uniref:Vps16 C-terminal domain-containing protein n=1 Tax=Ceutorhynchus assimilis TaxID=467358 RepID=A0A9N9MCS3_9CUCU|nr:unnamed protein product [Ceutorhynchus assimilis]